MYDERQLTKLIEELLIGEASRRDQYNEESNESREIQEFGIENQMEDICIEGNSSGENSNLLNIHCDVKQKLSQGKIWVKNNDIFVEGLPGINILPSIEPTEGINLFVNGKLVKSKITVSEQDYIYVEFITKEEPLEIKITRSEDGLTAYMSVKLQTVVKYSLEDQLPKQKVILKTFTTTTKHFPLGLNDLLTKIKESGITSGLDYLALQEFLANPRDGKFVIARGVSPTEPRDDTVDVLFPEQSIKLQYSPLDRVDFYNLKSIPSVEENSFLAVRREGEPGQPGLSVAGDMILPREPKRIILRSGKGVRIEDNMVYSSMSGRPMVKRVGAIWLFYVDPYLTHYGDIDLSIGNQNFRGNIQILGNILDGLTVRAGGNIEVAGSVGRARVVAMESVVAGKCIGSLIQAGGDSYSMGNSYFALKELHAGLEQLLQAVNVVIQHPKLEEWKAKIGLVLLLLIEKKFKNIPGLLKTVVQLLEITPVDMPPELRTLAQMIKEHVPPRNLTIEKLEILIEYIKFAQDYFKQMCSVPADVRIGYAFNSIVAATGDVYITGQGCFNTKITAGGNVNISGVIRGGEVNAKGDIVVEEAGSDKGVKTVLKTSSGKITILKKVYDGVIVMVGGLVNEITATMGPVQFRKTSNGKLLSSSEVNFSSKNKVSV